MLAAQPAPLVSSLPSCTREDARVCAEEMIVVFNDRHYVLDRPVIDDTSVIGRNDILDFVRDKTGFPVQHLYILPTQQHGKDTSGFNVVVVRVRSQLLGGKGGFGSLLKSQSRQAGARATTHFGACRDLQGRRLRHVNDAVAAQQTREWQQKIAAGQATEEDRKRALVLETESHVPGWHLQLPAWADVSKKETRKWKRQFKVWQREQEMERQWKEEEKKRHEARIHHYVETANQASETVKSSLQSALQEGLKKQQQQQPAKRTKLQPDPPTAFLTLAGDIVLASENDLWQVQSQSNFCTMGIVLQWDQAESASSSSDAAAAAATTTAVKTTRDVVYYWEVRLVTGGLSQIGWAEPDPQRFQPVSDTGDGVGDDSASFAYDGSRNIFLHQSESKSYGGLWKAGDVVGCVYNQTRGEISFSLNGQDLGVAHTLDKQDDAKLFPAASCNPKETLELHLTREECQHLPKQAIPVGDILATENVQFEQDEPEETKDEPSKPKEDSAVKNEAKAAAADAQDPSVTKTEEAPKKAEEEKVKASAPTEPTAPEPLENLDDFGSVAELEALGLDRLKSALMALGVKCGGTLQQRAKRLYSLKGLKPEEFPPKLLAKKPGKRKHI